MAPAVLPWPALRSLLDAVGFAIAVSVAKQKYRRCTEVRGQEHVSAGGTVWFGATPLINSGPSKPFGS